MSDVVPVIRKFGQILSPAIQPDDEDHGQNFVAFAVTAKNCFLAPIAAANWVMFGYIDMHVDMHSDTHRSGSQQHA